MKKRIVLALVAFTGCASGRFNLYEKPRQMIVKVKVADVRAEPVPRKKGYAYDPLQETQVEQGEPVLVWKTFGGWAFIECVEQPEFTHHSKWEGYPGWIEKRDLTANMSMHHSIQKHHLSEERVREKILERAQRHLGERYLWGGKSLHNANYTRTATGVDCSGLVHWAYRQVGWIVPRDSHEQHMRAHALAPQDLKPADLIFLAKTDAPEKIVHVALYEGNDMLLEAPQTGEAVRSISFRDRFGKSLSEMKEGMTIGDRIIHFGTFFPEEQ